MVKGGLSQEILPLFERKEIQKEGRKYRRKEGHIKGRKRGNVERNTFGEGDSSFGDPSSVRKPESVSKASSLQLYNCTNIFCFRRHFEFEFILNLNSCDCQNFASEHMFTFFFLIYFSCAVPTISCFTCLSVQSFSLIFAFLETAAPAF